MKTSEKLKIVEFSADNLPDKKTRTKIEEVFAIGTLSPKNKFVWIALLEEEPVGILNADISSTAHIIHIERIDEAKHLGVATQLHAKFEKRANNKHQETDIAADKNKVRFFFEDMGYTEGKISSRTGLINYFKPTEVN